MSWWKWLILVSLGSVLILGGYIFSQVRHIEVEQLSDDLYVLSGLGGNVAVLNTQDGAVVVDTMTLNYQGGRIKALASELTGKPVIAIINTHYHLDHTHGNPAFDVGTRVISTARTLHHLEKTDAAYFSGEAKALMPTETFIGSKRINFGDKNLRLIQPGPGHTDGDLVVIFEEENTIHMGDLLFNHHYPNIDLEAGGTVQGWGDTLDKVLALSFDQVIPGHGAVTDREGIKQYQIFIRQLAKIGVDSFRNSRSLEETIASSELTADLGYEEIKMVISIGLSRAFVLQRAWEEANGKVDIRP